MVSIAKQIVIEKSQQILDLADYLQMHNTNLMRRWNSGMSLTKVLFDE